ncbi:tetratricopeptide repeat protein [Limnohabitans sp. DCL3]|jgi:tetratricopeptide (TPR) repeat protein|uniref:tetratricopeptide repeat protein n=1 Tax=Limnohabitans sp. DCL3 TaxID=3374103 RepID=UPI003A8AF1CF
MSVNTPSIAGSSRTAHRGRCFGLRLLAKILLVIGLRNKAHEVFQKILEINPQDVLALNSVGFKELNDRRLIQALEFFERALVLTPNQANAHFNVGFVCEELGRSHEAEQAFRSAIRIDEKMDRAWYGLGLVLVRQQRFEASLVAFRRNTELQSMSPYAWYQMARVHMEMAEPDKALDVMRHLNGFEPQVAAQLERETGLRLNKAA